MSIDIEKKATEEAQTIISPNGEGVEWRNDENIVRVTSKKDKYVFIIRQKYDNIENYRYEILDGETFKVLNSGEIFAKKNLTKLETPIFQYKNIFDVDTDVLEENDRVSLISDEPESHFNPKYGVEEGKTYTKFEIEQIREKLYKVINKINIPPEGIKDREKIIYAQIVKNLHMELIYDSESRDLIKKFNEGEIDNDDEKIMKIIDSTQNLRGLLKGKTVCRGFAGVVDTLAGYFGLDCKVVSNGEHAWNLIILDGEKYEDDFTWYRDKLAVSNLAGIDTFLRGINFDGNRSFDGLKYHEIGIAFELDKDISRSERINLLGTDWSKVEDWESVNIRKTNKIDSILNQLEDFSTSKKTACVIALNRAKGRMIHSDKSFLVVLHRLFDKTRGEYN